jgi:hypothetical protein
MRDSTKLSYATTHIQYIYINKEFGLQYSKYYMRYFTNIKLKNEEVVLVRCSRKLLLMYYVFQVFPIGVTVLLSD